MFPHPFVEVGEVVSPSILPSPTLLTTTSIALANGSLHKVDRPALGAGTTFGTAGGREGGHFVLPPHTMPQNAPRRQ